MLTDLNASIRGLTSADIDTLFGTRSAEQSGSSSAATFSGSSSADQVATYGTGNKVSSATASAALLAQAQVSATFDSAGRLMALSSSSSIDATFSYASTTIAADGTTLSSRMNITAHQDPNWESYYTYDFQTDGSDIDPAHRASESSDYTEWDQDTTTTVMVGEDGKATINSSNSTVNKDISVADWIGLGAGAADSSQQLTTDLYARSAESIAAASSNIGTKVTGASIAAGLANKSLVAQRVDEVQGLDYQSTEQVFFGHSGSNIWGVSSVMIHKNQSWNDDFSAMPSVSKYENHAISSVDGVPVLLSWND